MQKPRRPDVPGAEGRAPDALPESSESLAEEILKLRAQKSAELRDKQRRLLDLLRREAGDAPP